MEDEEQRKPKSKKVSLKLVIDKKENRVLYGEADNKFIDFLFTVLALPVGTVVKLLSTEAMAVGSSSNLLRSVDAHNLLEPKKYYLCSNHQKCKNITATFFTDCPQCLDYMYVKANYVYGSDEARPIGGGYVKEGMFMVMDDLTVKPLSCSSMSTILTLNELNVKDIGFIEEELVHFDINEGVKLLKAASVHTATVLTDVFLRQGDSPKHHGTLHILPDESPGLDQVENEPQRKPMSTYVSLKLVIDKKGKRVLFGEADNTFIDFLFTVLALPVGTVVKLLSTKDMVSPISNLFRSVDALNDIDYFEPNRHTHNLLKPPNNYYTCSLHNFSCTSISAKCPQCDKPMSNNATYVYGSDEARPIGGSYVKEGKFLVMDDLTVKSKSFSSMSTILTLKELNVKDIGFIVEELVHFDIDEGMKLLKASVHTTTVLTDMFLRQIDFSKHYVSIVKKE